MATPIHIGVDNGGTWIRFRATTPSGRFLWQHKKPSPPLQRLPAFIRRELCDVREPIQRLEVGSKGYWKPAKQHKLAHALRSLAKKIVVMSDVEATWHERFALGSSGIVLIAGTGSIAYGRNAKGAFARAGGLGALQGDEGSGFWIGREWLKKERITLQEVRRVASAAAGVIRRAKSGNPRAAMIVAAAQKHLVSLLFPFDAAFLSQRTYRWLSMEAF